MTTQYELVSSVKMYEFVGPITILSVDAYTQFGNYGHTQIGTHIAIDDRSEGLKNIVIENFLLFISFIDANH